MNSQFVIDNRRKRPFLIPHSPFLIYYDLSAIVDVQSGLRGLTTKLASVVVFIKSTQRIATPISYFFLYKTGRALLVVRSTGKKGKATITVQGKGLKTARVNLFLN